MSRRIALFITVLALSWLGSAARSQGLSSLDQIPGSIANTLQAISDPLMPPLQKLQAISHQKSAAEFTIREAILNGSADPAALNNPLSPTSQAFKSLDALTILSELQVEPNTGKVTPESCGRARATLFASNLTPNSENLSPSELDRQVGSLIYLMCGPK